MISSEIEYGKAREELDYLTDWLARLEGEEAADRKSLTSDSVRGMISRVQEEIGAYEAAGESTPPGDAGIEPPAEDENPDLPE